jgi:hypothetical protein
MASKRQLKKDIHDVLINVIEECYYVMLDSPGEHDKEMEAIIEEAVETMHDLIHRANWGDKLHDKKAARQHYNSIKNDLADKNLAFAERLKKVSV